MPGAPLAERPSAKAEVGELPDVVVKLAERMRQNPDDPRGWRLLGRSYLTLGRHEAAARAFGRTVALDDGDIEARVGLGEALTLAAEGTVTAAARVAFEAALARQPKNDRARYYLGLAARQTGRPQLAYDRWLALALSAPDEAPWLPHVLEQLTRVAAELGIDLAAELPAKLAWRLEKAASSGPDRADVEAAGEMTPEARQAFVRSMVTRLAARLEAAPDDADGWLRLGRAYRVLGRHAVAAEAYAKAAALRPDDASALLLRARVLIEAADPSGPPPAPAIEAYRAVLKIEPEQGEALWFTGLADAQAGRLAAAVAAWERLLPQLSPASDEHKMLAEELAKARARLQ
jgi:cytochrome c-type biogenesis protein CcmH